MNDSGAYILFWASLGSPGTIEDLVSHQFVCIISRFLLIFGPLLINRGMFCKRGCTKPIFDLIICTDN